MKRFVSVILTLAMVFALLPAILVSADDTTATMEMSGIRIEYPTCDKSSNETSKPPQTSTTFSNGKNPDVEITYSNSFGRVQWLSTTSPSIGWRDGAISIKASAANVYGAYKIRVPKAGGYNVTVQYRKTTNGCKGAEMYILPISAKDNIAAEISKPENAPKLTNVDFSATSRPANNYEPFAVADPFYWEAPSAGEYIIVWNSTNADGTYWRMLPANIIFDGCGDEKVDALVGEIELSDTELVVGENATITSKLYNGMGGKVEGTATYTSSGSGVLSVDGTTVKANKPGKVTLYAEVEGFSNKVALDVTVTAANMSGVRAQYPTYVSAYSLNANTTTPADITYDKSGNRVHWYHYTGTKNVTAPAWNSTVAVYWMNPGEYAAYKINIPAKGFYNVTLEYMVRGAAKADMYLLPGDTKTDDISNAINNAIMSIKGVDFDKSAHSANDQAILERKNGFDVTTAGEYLVVWMCTEGGPVRPKNLIFDGCKDGEEKNGLLGKITLDNAELVVGDSTTAKASFNDAYTGAVPASAVTYSCDSDVLSVNGTTITANKPGNATLYAEVAGYGNKVALDVTVVAANAPTELTENVNFAAGAAIEYRIGDGQYTALSANNVKSIPVGTEITVKANDDDNFAGWVRGTKDSKNWISDESEYTFTIMSHTYLTPVYTETEEADAEQVVEFWNENKEYLGSADVVEGKATAPVAMLTGHSFSAWHISETDILPLEDGSVNVSDIADAIIRAVAKHTVKNNYGTKIPNSNPSATYWKRGEYIVAYGSSYDFYQWNGAANITYGTDAIEQKPLVVLDSTSVDDAYMIEYDKGNATQIVEAGILFGSTANIHIGSTDGSKAASQRNGDHGQFCAKPNVNGNSDYARGYLIYRGTDNKLYVIYTDAIQTNQ